LITLDTLELRLMITKEKGDAKVSATIETKRPDRKDAKISC
jgi:hypothetical protein